VTPSRSAFSYAVVRVVPDIEREEFLNAGLILFSRPRRFILARTSLDEDRLRGLKADGDVDGLRHQLDLFERIAAGAPDAGPIARLSPSERFHWLTAPRSTAVQPGPIHTGVTDDPSATFEHLFALLVAR
jgi:DUF1365 family protein